MARRTRKNTVAPFVAAFLAWIVPGAGHVYLGRTGRGVILFVTIAATFWAGVAIGGVMTVDRQNERWWFAAQMLTGVHGLIAWRRQSAVHEQYLAELSSDPEFRDESRKARNESQNANAEIQRRLFARHLAVRRQAYLDKYRSRDGLALVAPANTVARAYAGVAGLLNVMCVFDALMLGLMGRTGKPHPGKRKRSATPQRRPQDQRKPESP